MVTVEEPLSDFKDLGPVIYQESKIMDNEIHLLCVHDNREKKFVNFEAYSFESGRVYRIQWDYMNFDSHFRFNAELMNPNNREGRYHWFCERLTFISDGKGERKLSLEAPTDDLPQVADKARNFKIPTGRMNYGDRQRLRLEMERLPQKREASIQELADAFKGRFVAEVQEAKELEKKKQDMRMDRINEERKIRYDQICENRRQESILTFEYADKDRMRDQVIKQKETRRKKEAHAEILDVLQRHEQERKATEHAMEEQRSAKRENKRRLHEEWEEKVRLDEIAEEKRGDNWKARDDRLEQKAIRLQADRNARIEAEERTRQARQERQKEAAHEMNMIRSNLWAKHKEKDQKRKADQQAALEAVQLHKEESRKAALLARPAKKSSKEAANMDAVETKIREKMEKQGKDAELDMKREHKFQLKDKKKREKEVKKVDAWKEDQEDKENKRLALREERAAAKEEADRQKRLDLAKKRDQLTRKNKMRDTKSEAAVNERMKKLVHKFKPRPNEFVPMM